MRRTKKYVYSMLYPVAPPANIFLLYTLTKALALYWHGFMHCAAAT